MNTFKRYSIIALFIAIAAYATIVIAGAPLKGVEVKLQKAITAGDSRTGSSAMSVTTDHEGKFTFTNLSEGTYEIYCSYEQCAKAINTNGHGATVREAVPQFQIELLPTEGVGFAAGPRQTTSQDGTYAGSNQRSSGARITATQNSQSLRTTISSSASASTPLATITVSGKQKELTGHVTLIK